MYASYYFISLIYNIICIALLKSETETRPVGRTLSHHISCSFLPNVKKPCEDVDKNNDNITNIPASFVILNDPLLIYTCLACMYVYIYMHMYMAIDNHHAIKM